MELTQRQYVNLFHILAVAPFLGYIGYRQGNVDKRFFQALVVISVVIVVFHTYRFNQQMQ